ncbi:MAG: 50S ribosomal protein L23 [Bacteroidota bacterium]
MDTRDIIKRPIVTEKTTGQMEENKYNFVVDLRANKHQIKKAVEEIFKVKVVSVNTLRVLGKEKRMGRNVGKRPDWKKAVVTLAPGNRIQFFEGV